MMTVFPVNHGVVIDGLSVACDAGSLNDARRAVLSAVPDATGTAVSHDPGAVRTGSVAGVDLEVEYDRTGRIRR
jgi:hypothetical protein